MKNAKNEASSDLMDNDDDKRFVMLNVVIVVIRFSKSMISRLEIIIMSRDS